MKKNILVIAAILLAILISAVVIAEETEETKTAKGNELNARYKHTECRANLVKTQAEKLEESGLINATKEAIDKLIADLATLKGYADSGNVKEFNAFIKTIKQDVKNIQDLIKTGRKNVKGLGKEKKQALKDVWKTAVSDFAKCNGEARRNIAKSRSDIINNQINEWNEAIEEMKEKGLDTTEAESVIADANQLTTILNQATTATTDEEFKEKVNEARNLHLHLWARFHIAKLNAYIAKIEPKATEAGLTDKVTEIKALLSEASSIAQPGKKYEEDDFKTVWSKIKEASNKLKDLAKEIKQKKGKANK